MLIQIYDGVLEDPDEYVDKILSYEFFDVTIGEQLFKGILPLDNNPLSDILLYVLPGCVVNYNFVRKSPGGQIEPNFIHQDDMMGSMTAILYLNKNEHPGDGTSFYNEDETLMSVVYAKYNRLIIFDSEIKHSRNIFENFGDGDDSRLIQVAFIDI